MIVIATHLAAAVALLLWSVRMIQTGVERAFMPNLKRGLKTLSKNTASAAAGGGLAAMLLQSSTAVALIGAGFAVSGMLAPYSALALLLGADLGSAVMAQVLFLPVAALVPFFLLFGVVTFLKANSRKSKQIGRIMIGFALVLIALGMIREATASIGGNAIVQSIAAYFEGDLLGAYALGALLAWAMHSSLAAVLTFATFALTGLIAAPVAAALVIGANLGGAVIPFALLWSSERPARLVVLGNLVARGGVTLVALALLVGGFIPLSALGIHAGQQTVTLHIALNAVLLLAALPFVTPLTHLVDRLLPRHPDGTVESVSALDAGALDHPPLALSVLTTGDVEAARQLVVEKDRIRLEEQKLQERHLKRLQPGATASLETTNIHQETLRLLKQINAALTYVAYPITEETGDLLHTRLAQPSSIGGAA